MGEGQSSPDDSAETIDAEGAEPGTWPLRPVLAVAAVLLVGLLIYAGYSCVRSSGGSDSFSAPVNRFPLDSVTYVAPGRFYLVHTDTGAFVALSEVEDAPADRIAGCLIRYRPDLGSGDEKGVFRDDCHGTLFNRDGDAVEGSAPSMQRHPVRVTNGNVTVPLKECIAGGGAATPEVCRE
jgi:hypothetical protein